MVVVAVISGSSPDPPHAPSASGAPPILDSTGLDAVRSVRSYGGHYLVLGWSDGGPWALEMRPR